MGKIIKQLQTKDEILIIKNCGTCPLLVDIDEGYYCALLENTGPDYYINDDDLDIIIPECKLEDFKGEQES